MRAPFPLTSGPVSSGTASPRHRLCLSGGTAPSASHHANTVFYLGLAADNRNPRIPRAVNGLEFPCLAHINGALPLPSSIISAKPTENIPSPCVTKRMADGEVAAPVFCDRGQAQRFAQDRGSRLWYGQTVEVRAGEEISRRRAATPWIRRAPWIVIHRARDAVSFPPMNAPCLPLPLALNFNWDLASGMACVGRRRAAPLGNWAPVAVAPSGGRWCVRRWI